MASMIDFFLKTDTIFNSSILAVVWNNPVSVLFVQFDGFRLSFSGFEDAFFAGQFNRIPLIQGFFSAIQFGFPFSG